MTAEMMLYQLRRTELQRYNEHLFTSLDDQKVERKAESVLQL